ncbi:MAG: hypothetical protein M3137_11535 [Actinomycetota bacterium]|nr:hypothetical protein [Actinomycetota bacterium]
MRRRVGERRAETGSDRFKLATGGRSPRPPIARTVALAALVLTMLAGLLAPAAVAVSASTFVLPTAIKSEPVWANPSGFYQPFSYNCPPNIGLPPPPVDPPSSWAAFLATSLVGQDFVDAVTRIGNDAVDASYAAYKAAQGGQDPPGFSSVDAVKSAAKSRLSGALASTSFWSGVVERLGNYGMPHGVDPEQFLGYAASYYGLSSDCDQSAPADTWLYSTSADDFFLQQGSSWARVVVHGGTLSSQFGFEPIRGTSTPHGWS